MEPTEQQIQAMQDAERARAVLEDPLVKDALASIEREVIGQWADLSVENKSQAEELKRLLWAAKQFRNYFEVLVLGGTVARNEMLLKENMEIKRDAAIRRIYA